jgi:ketosteroid isomerase-like protein
VRPAPPRIPAYLLALASLMLSPCCQPHRNTDTTTISPDSLRSLGLGLSDRLGNAYKRADWPAVAALLAPDYLGTAPGLQWDTDSLKKAFPSIHYVAFRRDEATVKQIAPTVLLVNEDGFLTESQAGQEISGRYRFTNVWVQRDQRWQLVVEQEIPLGAHP